MITANNSTQNSDIEIARRFIDFVQKERRRDDENSWLAAHFDHVDELELAGSLGEWRDAAIAVYLAQKAKAERVRNASGARDSVLTSVSSF